MTRKNMMKVTFDGIGFINNRGTSKYWGVCKTLNDDKNYRVTVRSDGATLTFHTDQSLGRITEELAAQLAAPLYKYRHGAIPAQVNVKIGSTIYRLDSFNKKIYTIVGELGTPLEQPIDDDTVVALTTEPKTLLNQMLTQYNVNQTEREFITDVFNKATGDEFSYRGRKILGAVIRSAV